MDDADDTTQTFISRGQKCVSYSNSISHSKVVRLAASEDRNLNLLEPRCDCDDEDTSDFGSWDNVRNSIVTINISGATFQTNIATLSQFPHTLLGDPLKRKTYYDRTRDEYFFDRHRSSFEGILYYYQSGGDVRLPSNVPIDVFVDEMVFFELGDTALDKLREREGMLPEKTILVPAEEWKRILWLAFEFPETSSYARLIASISVCTILLSVTTLCLETLPEFKRYKLVNVRISKSLNGVDFSATVEQDHMPQYIDALFVVETLCISWFVVELLIRFTSCPRKVVFLRNFINIIDLVSIAPYFIMLGAIMLSENESVMTSSHTATLAVLRVIRLVRVFRVLKLSRHIRALQILGRTLKASIRELGLWIFFILISVVLFSSAAYFAEIDLNESYFRSIPEAFWYSLVTMTTVGYGDMRPVTFFGKVIGSWCAIAGVLTIALPVPIIVSNFNFFYFNENETARKQQMISAIRSQSQDTTKVVCE